MSECNNATPDLRNAAEIEFKAASTRLAAVFPKSTLAALQTAFPQFNSDTPESNAAELENMLEKFIRTRNEQMKPERFTKVKTIARRWIKASYPFAQLVFTVAKEGSQVREGLPAFLIMYRSQF